MQKPKVIAVVGPTASGKTALGIFLAQKLGGEVISADSRQVYKGLNLGTGKATKKEMAGIPHHLIDVASPKKQFSVSEFVRVAEKTIGPLIYQGTLPLIVGGTGLYVDTLLGRMSYADVPPNLKLRAQLEKKSAAQLFAQLQKLDPRRAASIEKQNPRRLVRAIEIAKAIGKSPTTLPEEPYDVLWLGIVAKDLQKNIRTRLHARIKAGMIREAKKLHAEGLSYKRMEELGLEYRYLARLQKGTLTRKEFEVQLEREINNYAKRQMRWFKRNKHIHWVKNKAEALKLSKAFTKAPRG